MGFTGQRVRIRAVTEADLSRLLTWDQDPEISTLMGRRFTQTDMATWFRSTQNNSQTRAFMIETLYGRVIGELELSQIDWRSGTAELCICIGEKDCWGQGYGSESMELAFQAGFGAMGLKTIFLRVFEMNRRAVRLYQRLGFKCRGILPASSRRGDPSPVLLMDLSRERWLRSNQAMG
ncbi:MAG: GNAT family N-acetyltransferase [Chitinophagales bacterium]